MSGIKNRLGFGSKKHKSGVNVANGIVDSADRKVVMGQHWHQQCFKCTTCGRFLDPGRHQECDGQPYCQTCYLGMTQKHVPVMPPQSPQEINDIKSRIKDYNLYKQNPSDFIKHKEVGDGCLVYEGVIRLYWGLKRPITLSAGASGYGRQRGPRESFYNYVSIDDEGFSRMFENVQKTHDIMSKEEIEELMSLSENGFDENDRVTQSLNESALIGLTKTESANTSSTIVEEDRVADGYAQAAHSDGEDDGNDSDPEHDYVNIPPRQSVIMRQKSDSRPNRVAGHAGMRRRSASFRKVQRQRRQAEAREERRSKFIPPYGKPANLRVSSIQGTEEVIAMLLQKFNAENPPSDFALFIIHDSGAVEVLNIMDSPLAVRLKLGPSEDVAKIFVMEKSDAGRLISQETAEYIKFQLPELNLFLKKYQEEEEREAEKLKKRFEIWKSLISEQLQFLQNSKT